MAAVSGADLVRFALQFLGTPYVWGGSSPSGFDCSGLMQYVYRHFGLDIPRVTYDQIKYGRAVRDISAAQAGDLVFFDSDHNGTPSHVGMYMGNGQIVVADTTGTPVRVRSLAQEDRILGVVRMPGVVSTTSDWASGPNDGLYSLYGATPGANLPVMRPTFDMWSALGVGSPTVTNASESVGLVQSFIGSDPDLQKVFSDAVAYNYSTQQFQRELMQTDWWRNNSATVRQNLALKGTDPASWQQKVANAETNIDALATKLGVHLSSNGLMNVANSAIMMGWNDATIQQVLSQYLEKSSQGWYGGYAGQLQLGLKEYAADQGISVSDSFVNNAVNNIVAGKSSLQAYRAMLQTQAASAFPAYADQINAGVTVGKIAQPYASTMSALWEQDPNSISLQDPTLRQALQRRDAQGNHTQLTLTDFERELRQDPKWLKTNNARRSLLGAGNSVLSDLGFTVNDVGPTTRQTAPDPITTINGATASQNTGLSGMTSFPTLQGSASATVPPSPIDAFGSSLTGEGSSSGGSG